VSKGTLLDVVVENMHEQYQEFVRAREAKEPVSVPLVVEKQKVEAGQIAAIAVAPVLASQTKDGAG
jgi:dihydroxyacetone kinase-like predicted kinase